MMAKSTPLNLHLIIVMIFLGIFSIQIVKANNSYYNETWTVADQCGEDYKSEIALIKKLQIAVKEGKKNMVVGLIYFPMKLYVSTGNASYKYYLIRDAKEFLKKYDLIFNENTKETLLKQNPEDIFCNYRGAMIANGMIWFNNKIFEINITN